MACTVPMAMASSSYKESILQLLTGTSIGTGYTMHLHHSNNLKRYLLNKFIIELPLANIFLNILNSCSLDNDAYAIFLNSDGLKFK